MEAKRTKILGEEEHAKTVDAKGNNLRDDHIYVPGRSESPHEGSERNRIDVPDGDLQRDHDEFVKDQRSERNGDDVQKLVLEQNEGYDHNRGAWPRTEVWSLASVSKRDEWRAPW